MEKLLTCELLPGALITRCRIGKGYQKVSELSYIPLNIPAPGPSMGRANRQGESIFYGVITEKDRLEETRYVSLYETSQILRDINAIDEEYVTYSRWEVTRPMTCALIVHSSQDYTGNQFLIYCQNSLLEQYGEYRIRLDENLWLAEHDRYAELLSRPGNEIYSDTSRMCGQIYDTGKVDGIIYPSVATEGKYGANIAILPKAVDDKLMFKMALVCFHQKNGKDSQLTNCEHGILKNERIEYVTKLNPK